MAITNDYILKVFNKDIIFAKSYIRIDNFYGNKQLITLSVGVYDNASTDKFEIIKMGVSFVPDLEGFNFIAQGYDYLKTLPEFAKAIDC
jgi:hypothetical protein